jgi:hypothetical protein
MKCFLVIFLSAGLSLAVHAESHDCLNPSLVVSDGRIVSSQFDASVNGSNPTYWYAFYAQAGHSYAVEFVATTDNENTTKTIQLTGLTVWGPSDTGNLQQSGCRGTTSLSWTSTQKYSPTISRDVYGNGQRLSLTQPASGLDIIAITNTQAAGGYSYRITDTTMFNPRWSTYSGYDTQWGFTNMSDMTVTGTLSIYNMSNQLLRSVSVTIPAGGQVFRLSIAGDINLPRENAGSAIFSHNGPPHAILGDTYMLNGNATLVVYSKFESRYAQ